jgi:NitT/TauT family transport system ATP-binding protein
VSAVSDEAPLLQAEQLGFSYPSRPAIVDRLDLSLQKREIVALLGGSGCGKSSLLRILSGLASPQRGTLRFLGEPVRQPHPRSALLFQQPSLLPWLKVDANVAFGLDFEHQPRTTATEREARTREALAAVGLSSSAGQYPAQLSGGMAQRVALARALARQPLLLFADEPFSALDAITRAEMQALLVDVVHRWQSAVLLVTHDIDEALRVADRVLLMGHGRITNEWAVPAAGVEAIRAEIHAALQDRHVERSLTNHLH